MSKENITKETDETKERLEKEQEEQSKPKKKKKKDATKALKEDLKIEKERNLRLFAEFENYKKRTSKERIELFKTASKDVMVSLLPVLDDFERALTQFSDQKDDIHVQGMTLISNKLKETLKQKGLTLIATQKGDIFNADIHEAVTQIPAPEDSLKGKIIDIIESGYQLGEKIIRFPKVVIGQ